MAAETSAASAAAISLGQTIVAYQYFLPRLADVRRADLTDTRMRGDVRLGQLAAGGVALAIGILLSVMAESALPVWVTLIIAGIIAAVYQIALNGQDVMEG